jgi:5-methylcytosine-specific restriction enzyme A
MRYCVVPGCRVIVTRGRCPKHAVAKEHERPNLEVRKWYRTARWFALRTQVLAEERICAGEGGQPCGRPTVDVDHIRPHEGDAALFWNRRNLRGKCHACHSAKTAREREDRRAGRR